MVISLLGLTPALSQASLPQDINHYFRQIHGKKTHVSIEIKTPIERWPICEKPQINPPIGGRNMGNVYLPVQCGKKAIYSANSECDRPVLRGNTQYK